MNSLKRKKATKAACRIQTARFSGVYLFTRGGLPPRIMVCLIALLLSGCASLTSTRLRPTEVTRNETTADSTLGHRFDNLTKANVSNPSVDIGLKRSFQTRETFQRSYIEKRRLKPAIRVALWATGAAIAGGGYYLRDQTGWSRLGELLMGGGGLIPLTGEIITASLPPVGEEWREESRVLPSRTKPAVGAPVTVNALNSTWNDTTDEAGTVTVYVASLADSVPFGEPLEVQVTMLGEIAATEMFTVPSDVVNALRTPPVVEFAGTESSTSEDSISFLIAIQLSKRWHDSITVNCWIDDGKIHSHPVRSLGSAEPLIYLVMIPVVIPPGKTLWEEYVDHLDNTLDEEDRVISLALRNADNAVIGPDSLFSHTIFDDDPPPTVHFSVPVTSGSEALTPARLPVTLSSPSGFEVSVEYSVTGGTSEGRGVDFILEAGTLHIPMGDTSASIEFPVIDDAAVEGEETILVSLSSPVNATLGEITSHTYIIKDNDETVPVVVEAPADTRSVTSIAILDFEGIGISAQEARVLTNRLGTQMAQVKHFQVIERGEMQQILQEQDFQLTGCTSNDCAVEIGQLIGAQQMLAGSFGKLGTIFTIDMKIIDVETGRVLHTTSYDIEGSINLLLTEGLEEAVKRITGVN